MSFRLVVQIIKKQGLSEHQAEIEVVMNDDSVYHKHISTAKGNPANPLSMDELEEKFTSLTQHVLNDRDTHALLDQIKNIETMDDVSLLMLTIQTAIKSD